MMSLLKACKRRKASSVLEPTTSRKLKKSKQVSSSIETTEENNNLFGETSPGGLALRNPLVIEKILSFLNVGDLCRWYDSCEIFRDKIEQMDDIFLRREAEKLAAVSGLKYEGHFEEQWPGKSLQEIFVILKSDVKSLEVKIRSMFDPHPYPPKVSNIAEAASLVYHGILESVRGLTLKDVNLSSVPFEHFVSLVACVKEQIKIENVTFPDLKIENLTFSNIYRNISDLGLILDSVQCDCLSVKKQYLGTEDTRALVRAMKTRIRRLWLGLGFDEVGWEDAAVDIRELTKYDGKGKCEKVDFIDMKYVDLESRDHIKFCWAGRGIDWRVLADESNFIIVERKASYHSLELD